MAVRRTRAWLAMPLPVAACISISNGLRQPAPRGLTSSRHKTKSAPWQAETLERAYVERVLRRVPVGDGRVHCGRRLKSELAVGGLAAALAGVPLFFFHEVDGRGGDGFMDVTAAEAGAVRPVPVTFYDHGATAASTRTGKIGRRHAVSLPEPEGPQIPPPTQRVRKRLVVPAMGLPNAYGVSCRVRAERLPYASTPVAGSLRDSPQPRVARRSVPPSCRDS